MVVGKVGCGIVSSEVRMGTQRRAREKNEWRRMDGGLEQAGPGRVKVVVVVVVVSVVPRRPPEAGSNGWLPRVPRNLGSRLSKAKKVGGCVGRLRGDGWPCCVV